MQQQLVAVVGGGNFWQRLTRWHLAAATACCGT
eukprot:CAMPEP_0194315628 /NCGR_PEP_ID=MMETSP0171-20130528/12428_1 /TAXON_ID=218684 /ORGANISM="Corethron pennatum, Strain L29A3" /LENGTH=32 /DNA_ID= /DNA_START= /DNA_END= /DNA_ORIENTATION=